MTRYNIFSSALTLLLIANVAIGAPTHHTSRKSLSKKEIIKVQLEDEGLLKKMDKNHAKQGNAQAKYYKRLAVEVAKAGGDSKSLLEAAAYFEKQAK